MRVREPGDEVLLAWRIHQLREQPQKIGWVALGYALAFVLWWTLFPYPAGLFLPLIALTGALAEYLFPIDYRLTREKVYCSCGPAIKLELAWSDVRRARVGKDGIYLTPLKLPSRLDSFRGIRLRFGQDNEQLVRQTVKSLLPVSGTTASTPQAGGNP